MLWCNNVEKIYHITYLSQNLVYIFSTFSKYLGYSIGWESTIYRKKFQIPRRSTSKAATMTSNAFWLKLGIDTLCNENTHANLKSVLTAYPPSMPKHVNNYLDPNLEGSIIKILIILATQCIQWDFRCVEIISVTSCLTMSCILNI